MTCSPLQIRKRVESLAQITVQEQSSMIVKLTRLQLITIGLCEQGACTVIHSFLIFHTRIGT